MLNNLFYYYGNSGQRGKGILISLEWGERLILFKVISNRTGMR